MRQGDRAVWRELEARYSQLFAPRALPAAEERHA